MIYFLEIMSLVIGSLIIFLYGINLMKLSLYNLSETYLLKKINSLSNNSYACFFMGIFITCICQSSNAITILVLTLINTSYLNLKSGLLIILGSNIGTTITSFLIALNINAFSGFILLIGFVIYILYKDSKKQTGALLLGIGFLFWGLNSLSDILKVVFLNEKIFNVLFTINNNPSLNFFNGVFITALIQSSSASIGIIQKLFESNFLSLRSSILFVLGANVGTTLIGLFISFTQNKNAKKLASINTLFNIIGAILFYFLILPFEKLIITLSIYLSLNSLNQIALSNLLFNTITSLIFLLLIKIKTLKIDT